MSQREYAVSLVNNVPEDKIDVLIAFLRGITQSEDEKKEAADKELERKRRAFEELKALIKPLGLEDNDKEVLQRHREEKYGG